MSFAMVLCLAFGLGVVDGLRSLTAPAVACWAIHLGWWRVQGTPLAFMGSQVALVIFSVLAVLELVGDKLPVTPSRTTPFPLVGRLVLGGLTGATLCAAAGQSWIAGALAGAAGGLAGAFGGYQARVRTVAALRAPDWVVALLEDVVAVGGGFFLASRL